MKKEQYVCLVCGFNMVGFHPPNCPFCNASSDHYITSELCSTKFKVTETRVNDKVTCLRSEPGLGLEHSAYRVEAGEASFWIDSPSSFNSVLKPVGDIFFTHHHFLGASNLYQETFGAKIHIHQADSLHKIVEPFTFDETFSSGFTRGGIEAFHIGGHTPGFTFYTFEGVLFICDYVFIKNGPARLNPFGPEEDTEDGARLLRMLVEGRGLETVCGMNYFMGFDEWVEVLDEVLEGD